MKSIRTEVIENVFNIVLNRPEKRNAFDASMIKELTKALNEASGSGARLVYIWGEGQSFCAGADLEWMQSMRNYDFEENLADSEELFEMFNAALNCALPVLARVHGHVMGGANGLVATSDVVVAEENTKFAFSEVKLGLVPAVISPFVLRKMQRSSAREKMLTGRVFSAPEALAGGLVEFVGDGKQVQDYVAQIQKAFLAAGPEAVRETRQLLRRIEEEQSWSQIKSLTTKTIAERRVSEEGQEGLSSFFEKRKPCWVK